MDAAPTDDSAVMEYEMSEDMVAQFKWVGATWATLSAYVFWSYYYQYNVMHSGPKATNSDGGLSDELYDEYTSYSLTRVNKL